MTAYCTLPSLDLFSVRPIQTQAEGSFWVPFKPIGDNYDGTVMFNLGVSDNYTDPAMFYQVSVGLRVKTKTDATPRKLKADEAMGVVNNICDSLWSSVILLINNQ